LVAQGLGGCLVHGAQSSRFPLAEIAAVNLAVIQRRHFQFPNLLEFPRIQRKSEMGGSDVQAWLGSPRPAAGSRNLKPEPEAAKSPSRPKPWAQATAWST